MREKSGFGPRDRPHQQYPTNTDEPLRHEYLRDDNPLCRVPTLLLDDGEALFDRPVVCEYLDSLHTGPRLIPAEGPRWHTLRLQAIGDGMLDANVSRRMEMIRPPNEQAPSWIARQTQALEAACSWLESRLSELEGSITIGHIAVGCALGYFDIRYPDDRWRTRYPRLGSWYDQFETRPSMQATRYDILKVTLPASMIKEGPSRH